MVIGPITNALFAGLGAVAGRREGRRAERITRGRLRESQALFGQAIGQLNEGTQRSESHLQRLLASAEAGYAEQQGLVSDLGDEGFRAIRDAHTAGLGQVNGSFASRGFSGSSVHGSATRALASDVSRGVGNLSSQLAGVRSNLLRTALQDVLSARSGLANLEFSAGRGRADILQNQAQSLVGVGHQPAQGVAAGFGQIGDFLGQALTGLFGGDSAAPAAPAAGNGLLDGGLDLPSSPRG